MSDQDDTFDVTSAFVDIPLNEEVAKSDSKVKKRAEKRAKEDREKQREINREKRKVKKEQRELNKKRKRGEIPISDSEETPIAGDDAKEKEKKKAAAEKPAEFGVWVGNFSFQTPPQEIMKYFGQCGTVVRMRCPSGQRQNKNKGFAYIFFGTAEEMEKALELNEKELDGRALLIKKANDFERKDGVTREEAGKSKKPPMKQKNPPCATLFLGNLPFTATKEMIREQFQIFGDMYKVRMATFEDTGKCKGFGYIDFHELDSAVKAIRAPDKHVIDGRKIRVEYASEDAYNRGRPWLLRKREKEAEEAAAAAGGNGSGEGKEAEAVGMADENQSEPEKQHRKREAAATEEESENGGAPEKRYKKRGAAEEGENSWGPEKRRKTKASSGRLAPGKALSEAHRQKPTVQEFKGTKITFGDDD